MVTTRSTFKLNKLYRPIAIALDPSCESCIAMFAAMKTGRGFLPIDPELPIERIKPIFQECRVDTLITSEKYKDRFLNLKIKKIISMDALDLTQVEINKSKNNKENNGSMAYVIYTSGSTGQPKGVPITQNNLLALMIWQKKHFKIGIRTRMTQTLSLGFDFGIQEVLTTLLFGGTLFISDKGERLFVEQYADYLKKNNITMLYSTPNYLSMLCEYGPFLTLNVVLVGGEIFPKHLVNKLNGTLAKNCLVFNGYGPTEASINATMYQVDLIKDSKKSWQSIPIGTPSGNSKVYLLDRDDWPVAKGVIGEIVIGGSGVSTGYINQPVMSKAHFTNNSKLGLKKLYRTGDFARINEDGLIEYVGRKDNLVKVRGRRVELKEIETIISRYCDVQSVIVRLMNYSQRELLVAYYTNSRKKHTNKYFLNWLNRFLPYYMIPAYFLWINDLPLNKNGKLDEFCLKKYFIKYACQVEKATVYNDSYGDIQKIIQNVLKMSIGLHDNLFTLGIDSIVLPTIHKLLEKKLQLNFSIVNIFQYPTIFKLSQFLESLRVQTSDIHLSTEMAYARSKRRRQKMHERLHRAQSNKGGYLDGRKA